LTPAPLYSIVWPGHRYRKLGTANHKISGILESEIIEIEKKKTKKTKKKTEMLLLFALLQTKTVTVKTWLVLINLLLYVARLCKKWITSSIG